MRQTLKWLGAAVLAVLLIAVAVITYAMLTALDSERPVGFQLTQTSTPDGKPFAIGVWYPTTARAWPTTPAGLSLMKVASGAPVAGQALPLIVLSHGSGAGMASHADLALALASAGYVVAAPMHTGDNFADQSAVGQPGWLSRRHAELRATLDHLLTRWAARAQLDPGRVGAYGFSAGGFTVLTAAGAMPELRRIATHCAASPEFACELLAHTRSPLLDAQSPAKVEPMPADARLKAIAIAAPGLAFAFAPEGMGSVAVPVQWWSGERDDRVPFATNGKPLQDTLGAKLELHLAAGATHHAFLAPCNGLAGLLAPPGVCQDPNGFDRAAFHREMNGRVVGFFDTHLKKR